MRKIKIFLFFALSFLILLLTSCFTTVQTNVISQEDLEAVRSSSHGTVDIALNVVPYKQLWTDETLNKVAAYYDIRDTSPLARKQSSAKWKYQPPVYWTQYELLNFSVYYNKINYPPDDYANRIQAIKNYFLRYEEYKKQGGTGRPPDDIVLSVQGMLNPPLLLILIENKDTGRIAGEEVFFYATNRGDQIKNDEDYKDLFKNSPDLVFWKPSFPQMSFPLVPGNYTVTYAFLTFAAGNQGRTSDKEGNTKAGKVFLSALADSVSQNENYITLCFAGQKHDITIRNGDRYMLTLESVEKGIIWEKENQ